MEKEVKYILEETYGINGDVKFFDTKEEAIKAAQDSEAHLTSREKKEEDRNIIVGTIDKSCLMEEDDWESYHSIIDVFYDLKKGGVQWDAATKNKLTVENLYHSWANSDGTMDLGFAVDGKKIIVRNVDTPEDIDEFYWDDPENVKKAVAEADNSDIEEI